MVSTLGVAGVPASKTVSVDGSINITASVTPGSFNQELSVGSYDKSKINITQNGNTFTVKGLAPTISPVTFKIYPKGYPNNGSTCTVTVSPNSYAYVNRGLPSRTVTIQRIGSIAPWDPWASLIADAANSWNNSGAGVNITITNSYSLHTINVDSYGWTDGTVGTCYVAPDGKSSIIEIDTTRFPDNDERKRGVIVHEMGHLFWLANNATPQSSIMNYGDVIKGLSTPQPFDVAHVLYKYR